MLACPGGTGELTNYIAAGIAGGGFNVLLKNMRLSDDIDCTWSLSTSTYNARAY